MDLNFDTEKLNYSVIEKYENEMFEQYEEIEYFETQGFHIIDDLSERIE